MVHRWGKFVKVYGFHFPNNYIEGVCRQNRYENRLQFLDESFNVVQQEIFMEQDQL